MLYMCTEVNVPAAISQQRVSMLLFCCSGTGAAVACLMMQMHGGIDYRPYGAMERPSLGSCRGE